MCWVFAHWCMDSTLGFRLLYSELISNWHDLIRQVSSMYNLQYNLHHSSGL